MFRAPAGSHTPKMQSPPPQLCPQAPQWLRDVERYVSHPLAGLPSQLSFPGPQTARQSALSHSDCE